MSDYGFVHDGKAYTPNATPDVDAVSNDTRNREIEAKEIAWLKTAPDRVFLYVHKIDTTEETYQAALAKGWKPEQTERRHWQSHRWDITTWLGTRVSDGRAIVGSSVNVGGIAGRWAHKRSVNCRIFGTRYVGWYYESAGDYCRLRKAKVQR